MNRRDECVAHAVFALMAAGGLGAVTMRAIARQGRMALGTVGNHYGTKEHLLAVAAREIGRTHAHDLRMRGSLARGGFDQLVELLARDDQETVELRVWCDLVAAGRTIKTVGSVTALIDDELRSVVRLHLWTDDPAPDPELVDRAWLLFQAIRLEQVRPGAHLDPTGAAERWRSLAPPLLGLSR